MKKRFPQISRNISLSAGLIKDTWLQFLIILVCLFAAVPHPLTGLRITGMSLCSLELVATSACETQILLRICPRAPQTGKVPA